MPFVLIVIGIFVFYRIVMWAAKKDEENGVRHYNINSNSSINNNPSPQKRCPHCNSTDWQFAGQQTIGARDAKTKTEHKLNINPLKPLTIMDSKEKVVKKAKSGYSYDEFICLNCGKRFR